MKTQKSNALAPFILEDTYVRQDEQGRYSLNDLHQAAVSAGENARTHEPYAFLRRPETQGLIQALETTRNLRSSETTQNPGGFSNAGISAFETRQGNSGGTYVVRELVYAYAMWISPAFNLKVIRAYDALMTGSAGRSPQDRSEELRHGRFRFARQLLLDIEHCRTPFVRKALLSLLHETHAALDLPSPDEALLLPLADPNEQDNVTLSAFWDGYRVLAAHGEPLNHARDTRLIAINLAQFQTVAAKHRLVVPSRLALLRALVHSTAPKFHSQKTVKSQVLHATVHCWVFEEMPPGEDGDIST